MSESRVAFLTGASGGIGTLIARRLASQGVSMVLAGRNQEACAELAAELRAEGGTAWPVFLDLCEDASIPAAVEAAGAACGSIDWLINNAGIAISAPLLESTGEDGTDLYAEHLRVNFHGPRRLMEECLPGMRARGYGRVVNVASSAGLRGYSYVSAYCASKHALVGYSRAAAQELAGSGIMVNALCPHYVDGPMLRRAIDKVREKTGMGAAEAQEFFQDQNPSGRLVRPVDVAEACSLLLKGDWNGLALEMDGRPFDGIASHVDEVVRGDF